jgi:PTS hybrid protein
MTVGFVIVSHSAKLAEGVVELAGQMTQGRVNLIPAGGVPDGSLGTSADLVIAAIERADSGAGVVVLLDLGSAQMTAEVALESLPLNLRERVHISGAPLVEGAVVAAIEAAVGSPLPVVAAAAENIGQTSKLAAASGAGATPPCSSMTTHSERVALLTNKVGLHARPASLFVQTAARFAARITVTLNGRAADGKRILALLQLGARCGDELTIGADGPDAPDAVVALIALIQRKFDEE